MLVKAIRSDFYVKKINEGYFNLSDKEWERVCAVQHLKSVILVECSEMNDILRKEVVKVPIKMSIIHVHSAYIHTNFRIYL